MTTRTSLLAPLALVAALAIGCVSSTVTPVGDHAYAPLAYYAPVQVYAEGSPLPLGTEIIGIVDYDNPGKYQVLSLQDVIPELEAKARSVGANGLIIDQTEAVKSGIISTGIHVQARALRVPTGAIPVAFATQAPPAYVVVPAAPQSDVEVVPVQPFPAQ
jgi:hypothetical protein